MGLEFAVGLAQSLYRVQSWEGLPWCGLTINGKAMDLDVDPATPLLWAIREQAGLTGTKYDCGIAQCGAYTVHVDGVAVRSCAMPVSAAVGTCRRPKKILPG